MASSCSPCSASFLLTSGGIGADAAGVEPGACADAGVEPGAWGAAAVVPDSCALTTPPSRTRPAQPVVHRRRHDFRSITFPRKSDANQGSCTTTLSAARQSVPYRAGQCRLQGVLQVHV